MRRLIGPMIILALLAGCGHADTGLRSAAAPPAVVVIHTFNGFVPQTLTVGIGTVVQWQNGTGAHTATSTTGVFDSGYLASGDFYEFAFASAGTYPYFCRLHADWSGTIIVDPALPTATPNQTPAPTSTPPLPTPTLYDCRAGRIIPPAPLDRALLTPTAADPPTVTPDCGYLPLIQFPPGSSAPTFTPTSSPLATATAFVSR